MRIVIDADLCAGHGRCYREAPELFEPDWQGHSTCKFDDVPEDLRALAERAIAACPEGAISEAD
jgi:ferredoxin